MTQEQTSALVTKIEKTLKAQYLNCVKSNNGITELLKDKEGNPHRSRTFSMKVHDSLVDPINATIENLKGTNQYIQINGKNVIGAYPSRTVVSTLGKTAGQEVTLSASIIFAEPVKVLEFVDFETGEVS